MPVGPLPGTEDEPVDVDANEPDLNVDFEQIPAGIT